MKDRDRDLTIKELINKYFEIYRIQVQPESFKNILDNIRKAKLENGMIVGVDFKYYCMYIIVALRKNLNNIK